MMFKLGQIGGSGSALFFSLAAIASVDLVNYATNYRRISHGNDGTPTIIIIKEACSMDLPVPFQLPNFQLPKTWLPKTRLPNFQLSFVRLPNPWTAKSKDCPSIELPFYLIAHWGTLISKFLEVPKFVAYDKSNSQ